MQAPKFVFLWLLSFAVLAGPEQAVVESQSSGEVVWVDVRSKAENQRDSIEGDLNIPHKQIVAGVIAEFPDKSTPIRLYCAKGGRAGRALDRLIKAGYSDVQNVGGIAEVRASRSGINPESAETAPSAY